jgi:hypothetical protein
MAPKYCDAVPDGWQWATSLSSEDVQWLRRLPYALDCPFRRRSARMHAPSLHHQDRGAMMRVRSISPCGGGWFEGDSAGAVPWAQLTTRRGGCSAASGRWGWTPRACMATSLPPRRCSSPQGCTSLSATRALNSG